ncbi:unnamed protein product [Cylindrotheca closterium]|uniref:Uncharacterized protein n=1 Tax=Cylindrotheca closterium TaxID=2856 RepID=A0AAD2FS85_9STRA|nr:unnamed protein product [Cylindrotheca closterium]
MHFGDHQMEWTNKSTTCRLLDGSTTTICIESSDRQLLRHVEETKAHNELGFAIQQGHEVDDVMFGKQSWGDINQRFLVEAAGLDVHFGSRDVQTPEKQQLEKHIPSEMEELKRPFIKPNDLSPMEVERRTGFRDLPNLLSYAIFVGHRDLDQLFTTCSKLTWLEEWLFYFEFKYVLEISKMCSIVSAFSAQNQLSAI